MRKVLVLLLSLLLLITVGALAEPTPSNVAITIDGVRTAFFDDAGNYLSPLEENGIIYVPVQQLAESLGLDVMTDPDKLAVTLNGVRTAFFAEDGTYLPPLNVNGILYAPLDAFIESAGIAVEKENGKYGFARNQDSTSSSKPTPEVTTTPTSTPVSGPTPLPTLQPVNFTNDASDFIYASNGKEIQINGYIGQSKDICIPETIDGLPVTRIGDYAFQPTELNVKNIGDAVSQATDSIHSIRLSKNIEEIGNFAFAYNTELSGVLFIPQNIRIMGWWAFGNNSLKGIIIDSSFSMSEGYSWGTPFANMKNLEFIYIRKGSNPKVFDHSFYGCEKLTIAIIPTSVTSISDKEFQMCKKLKIITPAGSTADTFAREHFIPVENDTYEQYVELFETTYPVTH